MKVIIDILEMRLHLLGQSSMEIDYENLKYSYFLHPIFLHFGSFQPLVLFSQRSLNMIVRC